MGEPTDDSSASSDGERIRGSYPGGPSKDREKGPGEPKERVRLSSAEEIEARAQEGHRRRVRDRRRKRVVAGFVAALVLAGGLGVWLGYESHRTTEEITAEQERERQRERGFDFGAESDRLLDQLWLMEDLERARNP